MVLLLIFLLEIKQKIAGRIGNNGTKDVKIMVPLKYLSNFWRTFEIPLINFEINLILTWSGNCFIIDALVDNQVPTFAKTDTKMLCSSCNFINSESVTTIGIRL